MKKLQSGVIEYAVVLPVMLIFFGIFYFDTIKSGFALFPGDDCDAFLNILAADSWSDVFNGKTAFRQNRIYYPFAFGRGFTDLSLSLYLLELPWRIFCGAGMFSSALLSYLFLFNFGILSMFYLLRKVLYLNFAASLGGALLAFYCNGCFVKLLHTQFFFMGLLPLLIICAIRYCQYYYSEKIFPRVFYGVTAILIFAAIAYSNYYTAFFAGLAAGIYFTIYAVLLAKKGALKRVFIAGRITEIIFLAVFGVGMFVPFFYTYIPLTTSDYARSWTAAQGTLPTLADIVNIGPHNLLWGKLYDWCFPPVHKYIYENYHGLPLLTLGVFLFCLYHFFKERKKIKPCIAALVLAMGVMYILSLKFAHGISLWYFIWKYVPGGSAIRAAGRIYVFMMIPLMIFIWYMMSRITRVFSCRKRLIICASVFLVLAVDNVNTMKICNWEPAKTVSKLDTIVHPPSDMSCFYVTSSGTAVHGQSNWGASGLQAWYIARRYDVFTINGYSGNTPASFLATDPWSPTYRQEISQWVRHHNLTNIYSFDLATGKWQKEKF